MPTEQDKPVITISLHAENRTQVNQVLREIKARKMSISATICQLLIDFAKGGFMFASLDVEDK